MGHLNQSKRTLTLWAGMLLLAFVFCLQSFGASDLEALKESYPHWDLSDKAQYAKIVKIDDFIQKNQGKGYLALFDWDGTVYDENIPVAEDNGVKYAGQPAWYMYMAYHQNDFTFPVFPMFDTKDGEFVKNVVNYDKFLENKMDLHSEGYDKFSRITLFTSGMTPEEVSKGVEAYLKVYQPEKNAFLPMLDIVQKMSDSGFNVWFITGSSQYFVAAIIGYIEKNINYTADKKYAFNICTVPYNPETGHIAGNAVKLLKNGTFSVVYDDSYVQNKEGKLYIVDEYGKVVVIKNLEAKFKTKAVFVAGNSGGDFYDVGYVAEQPDTLCIAVDARGKLVDQVKKYGDKIIEVNCRTPQK